MWWLLSAAWGGVYVNDVLVDPRSLAGTELDRAQVAFDAQGNIRIEAPGYKVEVVAAEPAPPPTDVPAARYWLVTEDHGSGGHAVEVWINDRKAAVVRSGEPQRIVDVGRWLQPGSNRIVMKATSTAASGGSFYLYVGTGKTDVAGTVLMDEPTVEFGLGASSQGKVAKTFPLEVPPEE